MKRCHQSARRHDAAFIECCAEIELLHEKIRNAIADDNISEVQHLHLEIPFNALTHLLPDYLDVSEFKVENKITK